MTTESIERFEDRMLAYVRFAGNTTARGDGKRGERFYPDFVALMAAGCVENVRRQLNSKALRARLEAQFIAAYDLEMELWPIPAAKGESCND